MEANNHNLKEIAKAAAEGAPLPQSVPATSVAPAPVDDLSQTVVRNANPTQVADVGGTAVIIGPPKKKEPDPATAELAAQLMRTPSPANENPEAAPVAAPVPTAIGLEADTLDTPTVPISNSEELGNIEDVKYNEDGAFSEGQLRLMEEHLPDVPADQYEKIANPIFQTVDAEIKTLVMQLHLSAVEAQQACYGRVLRELDEANEKYKSEHPNRADVVIDKTTNANDLGLTQEEHEKLERVRRVRLILVDDEELKNITIERPDENHKADYVKSIEGSVSKYHVPLPMLGDFVGFKGAQIVQMINIVNYEDSTLDETISMKASLIYDKIINGSVIRRFDENGKSRMSYNEFINKFPYQDIDMALYGILCASNMEESATSLTCEKCSHTWEHHYNIKNLLNLQNLSDYYKKRVGDILSNKSNDLALGALYEERRQARRYKSPFTGNIYDVSYPTVARAINLLKRIDENDPVMTYNSAVALYLSRVLVFNKDKGTYVEVTAEETDLLLDTVLTFTNEDMNMLARQIRDDLYYSPQFEMTVKCPSCHNEQKLPLTIENLIFLKAQDSMVEIEA